MLTPAMLQTMTPEEKTALLTTMGRDHYLTMRFASALARDLDMHESAVRRWIGGQVLVPNAVLFTLDAWVHGDGKAAAVVQSSKDLPADLLVIAEVMNRVTVNLRRIVNHQAALTGGTPAAHDDVSEAEGCQSTSEVSDEATQPDE